MKIGVPREHMENETRVALIPETVEKLVKAGMSVSVEAGCGLRSGFGDDTYRQAGASIAGSRSELLMGSDVIVRIGKPPAEEIPLLARGSVHVSLLDPFQETSLVRAFAAAGVKAVSLQMIPRTTRAQKMDTLSSQASIAGYAAAVLAGSLLNMVFPMMITPSGTLKPARVFVIGAGVAGLQAIATAKRLGARVEAFDTRPVVEEQVQSLGARFVKIDLGDTGQTKDGYATALTEEQLARQREGMKKHCASSDIVITTAQVFGKRAPLIVTDDMLAAMKPGSVVIDLAVEGGGNVEGSVIDREVEIHGVKVIGYANMAGRHASLASQMFSSNIGALLLEFWDAERKVLDLDPGDEIVKGCLLTADGKIVNERIPEVNS